MGNVTRARPPSMADVARAAGVSAQTVSRTLRQHENVDPEIRERVLAAVDRLGYRMNSAARALSSGRTRTIGIVSLATTSYSQSITQISIEQAAAERGYQLVSARAPSLDAESVASAMEQLERQGAEGLVLSVPLLGTSPAIEAVTEKLPTVTLDGSRTKASHVVTVDQTTVARLATEHLLSLGHETVWHVAGPETWQESSARATGWSDTLRAAGRDVMPSLHGDWSPESGYQNGRIIARISDATAVFVSSDEMAFGVIRALMEGGRRVPDDVSVVGVDDVPLAAYGNPPLTTVSQPFASLGRAAIVDLVAQIDETTIEVRSPIEPPMLIERDTTAHRN